MRARILGASLIGPFGIGWIDFLQAIDNPPAPDRLPLPGSGKTEILRADPAPLVELVPPRQLRRLDRFSRLALLAGLLAVRDAGGTDGHETGLVLATGHGAAGANFAFLDSMIRDGDALASPTLFSSSLANAAAAGVSMRLGLTGPGVTVSQFELSFHAALETALLWLGTRRADRVLLIGADDALPLTGYCRERLDTGCAVPGEGAAGLLLGRDDAPSKYGWLESIDFQAEQGVATIISGKPGPEITGPTANYAPLYGCFPASQALDAAVAALSLRDGRLAVNSGTGFTFLDMGGGPITCLTSDRDGRVGGCRVAPA